jgi:hypothetical protein
VRVAQADAHQAAPAAAAVEGAGDAGDACDVSAADSKFLFLYSDVFSS